MFDVATGEITLASGDLRLGAHLTRAAFLGTEFGRTAKIQNQYQSEASFFFRIKEGDLFSLETLVTLDYDGECLKQLKLIADDDRFGRSWSDWSMERELVRKAVHDEWLVRTAGVTEGTFPWGSLSSPYNQHWSSYCVLVRYAPAAG